MEKSEPTFVPQWLKSTGNITGVSSSAHHSALFPSHSDAGSLGNPMRNKSSKCSIDYDTKHSDFLERTTSSTSRRNSNNNGPARRPYSSFRSHRDRDRDKEKPGFLLEQWGSDLSDPVASILCRGQNDVSCGSRFMVSGRHGDALKNKCNDNHINNSGVILSKSVLSSTQNTSFGRKSPSFGVEEKLVGPDSGRVSSPGLSSSVQNLPTSTSVIGGEGWTSVLAEVSSVIVSNSNDSASVQTAASTSVSEPPNMVCGLNMAEALVQAPSRAQSAPQLYDQTQRLEELAIKQSRQLIPMTPSTTKASGFNSGDKGKPKTLPKSGEIVVAGKSRFKSDASNGTQVGKFHVLKPVWDNNLGSKDASSSISATNESVNTIAAPPIAAVPHRRNSKKTQNVGEPRKMCSAAQAQSRNDFFNLMRNKSNSMNQNQNRYPTPLTPSASGEETKAATAAGSSSIVDNAPNGEGEVHSNGGVEGELSPSSAATHLEEEEARFLRSLGWEEDCGEDEGLTEEEINSFFEVYVKSKPSPRG